MAMDGAGGDLRVGSEREVWNQQVRLIERTCWPGLVLTPIAAAVALAWFRPWADPARSLQVYSVVGVLLTLAALSAVSLWACARGRLRLAFAAQIAENTTAAMAFLILVENGEAIALSTAFVGVFTGAMILGEQGQKLVSTGITAAAFLAAFVREMGLVTPLVLPNPLLFAASAVAIAFAFRTPVSALRAYSQNLHASRREAVEQATRARDERDRADAKSKALTEATEELKAFTYFVSHDLRAPLINIEGFAKVLEEVIEDLAASVREPHDATEIVERLKNAQPEMVEALHFILGGTTKLNSLVEGLLELYRIDHKPNQRIAVALDPVLESIVDSMQHQIRERKISVEVEPLPTIVGDPLRVSQVFANLVDNAIKYMPDRDPREIRVSCEEGEKSYLFSVTDSGAGIDVDKRQKVFRAFSRLDAKNSPAGEGLGLAAVRKIVEAHGGSIWIDDAPSGQGTSFRFTWPRPAAPESELPARNAA